MQCLSCKNKQSTERCTAKCVPKFILCGRHLRMNKPNFWIDANPQYKDSILTIQRRWRGFWVRNRLQLGGPGILRRKECQNDEDMVTAEEKETIHPYEYFGLKEDGKTWWFEQRTIIQWAHQNEVVTNPYTRTPLQTHDLTRLRNIVGIRVRNQLPLWHTSPVIPLQEKQEIRWRRIVQLLRECGFEDLTVQHWTSLSFFQIVLFTDILAEELRYWSHRQTIPSVHCSRRIMIYNWFCNFQNQMHKTHNITSASISLAGILFSMAYELKYPNEIVFLYLTTYMKCILIF
jgi:hypothetical protein